MSTGRNVWFDLMTTDVDAATAFYTETIGWKTQAWEEGEKPYTMWVAGEDSIGGIIELPEEARQMGVPPHWMAYTTVEDIDASCKRAEALGGKVHRAPFEIPKVGRIAVLGDPQGALFSMFQPERDMASPPDRPLQHGWSELNTTDYEAAWKFYGALFDWKHRDSMDMGPGGIYFMWTDVEGGTKGGMSNVAKQMGLPPHWLHYVTVEDLDATIGRIEAKGGKILNGPMDIPGGDRIAHCQDPQGAAFAIYAHGKKD